MTADRLTFVAQSNMFVSSTIPINPKSFELFERHFINTILNNAHINALQSFIWWICLIHFVRPTPFAPVKDKAFVDHALFIFGPHCLPVYRLRHSLFTIIPAHFKRSKKGFFTISVHIGQTIIGQLTALISSKFDAFLILLRGQLIFALRRNQALVELYPLSIELAP